MKIKEISATSLGGRRVGVQHRRPHRKRPSKARRSSFVEAPVLVTAPQGPLFGDDPLLLAAMGPPNCGKHPFASAGPLAPGETGIRVVFSFTHTGTAPGKISKDEDMLRKLLVWYREDLLQTFNTSLRITAPCVGVNPKEKAPNAEKLLDLSGGGGNDDENKPSSSALEEVLVKNDIVEIDLPVEFVSRPDKCHDLFQPFIAPLRKGSEASVALLAGMKDRLMGLFKSGSFDTEEIFLGQPLPFIGGKCSDFEFPVPVEEDDLSVPAPPGLEEPKMKMMSIMKLQQCLLKVCRCKHGNHEVGIGCPKHGYAMCNSADPGYHLSQTKLPDPESPAPLIIPDEGTRAPAGNATTSAPEDNDEGPDAAGGPAADQEGAGGAAAVELAGFNVVGTYYESTVAVANVCGCKGGGVGAREIGCPTHGALKCVSCPPGRHMTPDKKSCLSNVCSCHFGTAGFDKTCPTHGNEHCVSCDEGFMMQPDFTCLQRERVAKGTPNISF